LAEGKRHLETLNLKVPEGLALPSARKAVGKALKVRRSFISQVT